MAATAKRVAKRVRPKPPAKKKAEAKTAPPTKTDAKKAPAKKKVAKSTAKAPAKKAAAKKTTTPKTATKRGPVREVNEHGFVPGTDSAKIADILLAGGKDRNDVNTKVEKAIGSETRNGTKKNVPALVSGVLNRLIEQGYKVDSSWVLNAPTRKKKVAKKK